MKFKYFYNPDFGILTNMHIAEGEGLIPKQTDDERTASILAQQALSDKQKMASYQ